MKNFRKTMVTFGMTVLAVSATAIMASANNHGGGHNNNGHNNYGYTSNPTYIAANYTTSIPNSICNIDGCTIAGIHEHNGINYFGHNMLDGHNSVQ